MLALHLFIALIAATIGWMLIVGTYRRWKWLIDPQAGLAQYSSQASLRKIIGVRGVVFFTYLIGVAFVAMSVYGVFRLLSRDT